MGEIAVFAEVANPPLFPLPFTKEGKIYVSAVYKCEVKQSCSNTLNVKGK
jgi:hypothetical protein